MELSTEEPETGIHPSMTLSDHSIVQPMEVAPSVSLSDYNIISSNCYDAYDGHISVEGPQMGPLSMPIFPGQFMASKREETMEIDRGVAFEGDHFDYDEQVAETMEESDGDSFGLPEDSDGVSGPSSSRSTHSDTPFSIYDGFHAPRRSVRERRLPAPFEMPLPREIVAPKRPGRPPKNQPIRGRGRPRKIAPPTSPTTSIPFSTPSMPYTSSFITQESPLTAAMQTSINENRQLNFQPLDFPPSPAISSSPALPVASLPYSTTQTHHTPISPNNVYPTTPSDATISPTRKRTLSARALYSMSQSPPEKATHHSFVSQTLGKKEITGLHSEPKPKYRFPALKHFTGPATTWFEPNMLISPSSTATETSHTWPNTAIQNHSQTPFSSLKYLMQPSQVLECKSGVISMALSPCGTMLACGTLLGQIYLFAAEHSGLPPALNAGLPPNDEITLPWNEIKWQQIAILQDFSETHVDRFWNIIWAPDASAIVAAGSCNARKQYDAEDGDLKVVPCPLVVFDLKCFSSGTEPSGDPICPKDAIRRFEGHFEEVVEMKIWTLPSSTSLESANSPAYLLITCSQDGHVRRWKFDSNWRHMESVLMKDEETWMAFSAAHLSLPIPLKDTRSTQPEDKMMSSSSMTAEMEKRSLSKESTPTIVQPTALFMLAGDMTLKLFDGITGTKIWTAQDLYETYCTNVDVFRTQSHIKHPYRPNMYLNGDGYVYSDPDCKHISPEEPPTFLILTKGIDFIAPDPKRDTTKKSAGGDEDLELDKELDDEYGQRRKSAPARVLLSILRLPLVSTKTTVPSSRNGMRRVEQVLRYSVNVDAIEFEPLFAYSHPLFESNYWPSRMTHNGIHLLSAASNGIIFAWNLLKSNQITSESVPSSSHGGSSAFRKPLNLSPHISSILASHDEDLPVRDVNFHPFWPFLFSGSDDGSVHVWAPALYDPCKQCSVPTQGATEAPTGASLSSVIVPSGTSAALSHPIAINHQVGAPQAGAHSFQAGSVYKSAIEAAMLASVGSVMPAAVKRKRGRPPKKKLIEEIEAQFAAQEQALQAQQLQIVNPSSNSPSAHITLPSLPLPPSTNPNHPILPHFDTNQAQTDHLTPRD